MKTKKIFLWAVILMNFVLLWRIITMQRMIAPREMSDKERPFVSPYSTLFDLKGQEWSTESILRNRSHALLVFFTLQDCASCLGEYVLWERLFKIHKVNVIAVARHVDEAELRLWVENAQLTFPVLYDADGELSRLFGIKSSPMKVLLDHRGRVLFYDPFRQDRTQMDEFISTFKNIVPIGED